MVVQKVIDHKIETRGETKTRLILEDGLISRNISISVINMFFLEPSPRSIEETEHG
jgi:hypothetical protein